MVRHLNSRRRAGFTLVELLTVVGIIALLISILLPSLAQARIQAKTTATGLAVKALGDGLEMFRNDFGEYPDSARRLDPISNFFSAGPNNALSGAHWLTRAMAGFDLQGVDTEGVVLADGTGVQRTVAQVVGLSRRGLYAENQKIFARDTDSSKFRQTTSGPNTGRHVIMDTFGFPVLYYQANARAKMPMGIDPAVTSGLIYNQWDNYQFTGADSSARGWDFAGAGSSGSTEPVHCLGFFGTLDPTTIDNDQGNCTDTFASYLHNHETEQLSGVIKPVKPDSYLLISAGHDGLYGTPDDVNNFKGAR